VNWILLLLISATASAAPQVKVAEQNTYEAVTGESADEDKSFWDSFYQQKDFVYGKDAVNFLKEYIDQIPTGSAMVPAMGEGRNAIFLAQHGFDVLGNDISEVAVDKARAEAKKANVKIKASVADLKQYKFVENQFDFIFLSLYIDRDLNENFKKAVKKGGYIMFYEEIYDGDPKKKHTQFYVRHNELPQILKDFKIITYREYDDHGKRVAAALAKKI